MIHTERTEVVICRCSVGDGGKVEAEAEVPVQVERLWLCLGILVVS